MSQKPFFALAVQFPVMHGQMRQEVCLLEAIYDSLPGKMVRFGIHFNAECNEFELLGGECGHFCRVEWEGAGDAGGSEAWTTYVL